jgi:hypothetical protein
MGNDAERAILIGRGLRSRDFSPLHGYLRGLRETRLHLRADADAARSGG